MSPHGSLDEYIAASPDSIAATNEFRDYFQHHKSFGVDGATWGDSEPQHCTFLPEREQAAYFQVDRVRGLLQRLYPRHEPPHYESPHATEVLQHYRGIFAVLLYIGRPYLIDKFVGRTALRKGLPLEHADAFPWSYEVFEEFYEEQWKFCVEPMVYERAAVHPSRQILPFRIVQPLGDGQNGQASLIQIHGEYDQIMPARRLSSVGLGYSTHDQGRPTGTPTNTSFYVVKRFHSRNRSVDETEEAWRLEARNHANVRQAMRMPGIVQFHGSFSHGGTFCILLEHANLGNLEQLLKSLPAPWRPEDILDFWNSFFSLLSPLAHLHGHTDEYNGQRYQICHFDIKPSNILVFKDETESSRYRFQFKLGDLGSSRHARLLDGSENHLLQNPGTRSYGAPEAYNIDFNGQTVLPHWVDAKVDLYSLGCIGSEIVAWMSDGPAGMENYRNVRMSTNRYLEVNDAFHDGAKTLPIVYSQHNLWKGRARRGCATVAAIEMIEAMLDSNPKKRWEANALATQVKSRFKAIKEQIQQASRASSQTPGSVSASRQRPQMSYVNTTAERTPPDTRQRSERDAMYARAPAPVQPREQSISSFNQAHSGWSAARSAPPIRSPSDLRRETHPETPTRRPPPRSCARQQQVNGIARQDTSTASQYRHSDPNTGPMGHRTASGQNDQFTASLPMFGADAVQSEREGDRMVPATPEPPKLSVEEAINYMNESQGSNGLFSMRKRSNRRRGPYWDRLGTEYSQRDFVILVDDSGSMQSHWDDVVTCGKLIAFFATRYDDDGVEVHYSISESGTRDKNASAIEKHIRKHRPRSTPELARISTMQGALSRELRAFRAGFPSQNAVLRSMLKSSFQRPKRKIIFVLSDGMWDANDVKEPIKNFVEFMKTLSDQDHAMVGIQFIHFGNDEVGWSRMKELDNFISKPDIVDAEKYRGGNVFKFLLGSINKAYDQLEDSFPESPIDAVAGPSNYSRDLPSRQRPTSDPFSDHRRSSSSTQPRGSLQGGQRPSTIPEEDGLGVSTPYSR